MFAVAGLIAIAVIHLIDASDTFHSTRYIFWLYMSLIVATIPVGGLLMHSASRWAWTAAALVATAPLVGYLVSRSVGLPGDSSDVGNWLDTLGMTSMFVELSVVSLSVARLALRRPCKT